MCSRLYWTVQNILALLYRHYDYYLIFHHLKTVRKLRTIREGECGVHQFEEKRNVVNKNL